MGTCESLQRWGWSSYFEALRNEGEGENAVPARVIAQHRKLWRIAGAFGECWAEASGKLRLAAEEGVEWPAVGDWAVVDVQGAGSSALILEVLPRRSRFVRKMAGKRIAEQVIAANVDTALLVAALDGDFSPRRMERYLAQCWEAGAQPVIVLNKADACGDARVKAAAMERIALGTELCVVSARTGQGMERFERFLAPGQTIVLLGLPGSANPRLRTVCWGKCSRRFGRFAKGTAAGGTRRPRGSYLFCPEGRC
jgi:ribosome biogenesis GTPase